MEGYKLPRIQAVSQLPQEEQNTILDKLFEPSSTLQLHCRSIIQQSGFSGYDDLIQAVKCKLQSLDTVTLDEVLASHARLGEKKVDSEQSRLEQAQLQSQSASEGQKLTDMNHAYEKTFSGLRYLTFVDGRPRSTILADMQTRIDRHDGAQERTDALDALCNIAEDRARKCQPSIQ